MQTDKKMKYTVYSCTLQAGNGHFAAFVGSNLGRSAQRKTTCAFQPPGPSLHWFAQAARTKAPGWGSPETDIYCLPVLEAGSQGVGRAGFSRGLAPGRVDAVFSPCPHVIIPLCVPVTDLHIQGHQPPGRRDGLCHGTWVGGVLSFFPSFPRSIEL